MPLVAGIDSSTQSCKVIIRDADTGALVREGRAPHPPGTEVHPDEWWKALQDAIGQAGGLDDVAAVSVGAQQHGSVLLDADGGVVRPALEQMAGLEVVHAYHLIPARASKARAVARHMQARGYGRGDCIAVGDSREDLDAASVVGAFWLVANALERDASLGSSLAGRAGVRVASEPYGAGVYEAVMTTLATDR